MAAPTTSLPPSYDETPRSFGAARTRGDAIFRGATSGAGIFVFLLIGSIAAFLVINGWPAISSVGVGEFLTSTKWQPVGLKPQYGVAGLLYYTVLVSGLALVIAVPISLSTAIVINEYAPKRLRSFLTGLVDLLAAFPSIIFGLWGLFYVMPNLNGTATWISGHLGWFPLFQNDTGLATNSVFMAMWVLAIMIVPITTSVVREVLSQVPRDQCEAALGLGGTRWGMVRSVVLPFGRSGIIGGSMLGLGRALGETVAIALILSPKFDPQASIMKPGGSTVASTIFNEFNEAELSHRQALMAIGLALFLLTLLVNSLARLIVSRSKSARASSL
ncbi:MAG: phosphate ABC transporter permease subunit PstC [Acidimicrobiia bacterium]